MKPKEEFLKSLQAKDAADLIASKPFRMATITAMLELLESYHGNQPQPSERLMQIASEIIGARKFLMYLENIAIPDEIAPVSKASELKYQTNDRSH